MGPCIDELQFRFRVQWEPPTYFYCIFILSIAANRIYSSIVLPTCIIFVSTFKLCHFVCRMFTDNRFDRRYTYTDYSISARSRVVSIFSVNKHPKDLFLLMVLQYHFEANLNRGLLHQIYRKITYNIAVGKKGRRDVT